ncbi:MAG: hypothetical protein IKH35_07285 [Prevotella sp.]|nr:hypothetical protein [Prevotella sp.]
MKHKAKLSMVAAFRYFLKGNMLFALNGIVVCAIDENAELQRKMHSRLYRQKEENQ